MNIELSGPYDIVLVKKVCEVRNKNIKFPAKLSWNRAKIWPDTEPKSLKLNRLQICDPTPLSTATNSKTIVSDSFKGLLG